MKASSLQYEEVVAIFEVFNRDRRLAVETAQEAVRAREPHRTRNRKTITAVLKAASVFLEPSRFDVDFKLPIDRGLTDDEAERIARWIGLGLGITTKGVRRYFEWFNRWQQKAAGIGLIMTPADDYVDVTEEALWDPVWDIERRIAEVEGGGCRWFHINVKNSDQDDIAIGCFAHLERVFDHVKGTYKKLHRVPLKWRGVNLDKIDIPGGAEQDLDAFHVYHCKSNVVHLPLNPWIVESPDLFEEYLLGPGSYALTYAVFCNFAKATGTFELMIGDSLDEIHFAPAEAAAQEYQVRPHSSLSFCALEKRSKKRRPRRSDTHNHSS